MVVPVTWTVSVAPAERVSTSQERTPSSPRVQASSGPEKVQVTPSMVGRASVSVTPVATPGPGLVTTIEKTIGSPALIVSLVAVFSIVSSGAVMVSGSLPHALVAGSKLPSPE